MIGLTQRQIRRYVRAVLWVIHDGLHDEKKRIATILALNAIGVATAAASLGTALLYANRAAHNKPMVLPGHDLPTDAVSSIAIVSAFAVAAGLLSATSLFAAQVLVQRLARAYQKRSMRRLLKIACRPDVETLLEAASAATSRAFSLPDLVILSSRFSAYALRALVEATLPLSYTILCIAFMFWIDPVTSAVLAGLAVFYLIPLSAIYRGVARRHRIFREAAPGLMSGLRQSLTALQGTSGPLLDERLWDPALLDHPELERVQDALYGRLLGRSKVAFLNGGFLVLCLLVIFLVLVWSGEVEAISWTPILAYLIALRMAWQGLQKGTLVLTEVNRFFPEFELLAAMLDTADSTPRPVPTEAGRPLKQPVCVSVGASDHISVRPGSITLALTGGDRGTAALRHSAQLILRSAETVEASAVKLLCHDAPRPIPGARLVDQALGLDATADRVALFEQHLRDLGVLDEIETLPGGLRTTLTRPQLAALSNDAAFAICAEYCLDPEPAIVVQSVRGLEPLTPALHEAWLHAHRSNALVLVSCSPRTIFQKNLDAIRASVDNVLVVSESGPTHSGSIEWLRGHRDSLAISPPRRAASLVEPLDSDDDLLLEEV